MSHEFELAFVLPGQPWIFAAPLVIIVGCLLAIILQNRRVQSLAVAAWGEACDELGLKLSPSGTKYGPIARGIVNTHAVTIATVASKGARSSIKTQYTVDFSAPEAPEFQLVQRTDAASAPLLSTGNPKFDSVVALRTAHPTPLKAYLTPARRAAILRLLTYWPTAFITDRKAHLTTAGIETDTEKLVDSICHLVAAAETFDRPSKNKDVKSSAAKSTSSASGETAEATREANGDGNTDVLTETRFDEQSILADLFNSGLSAEQIGNRFEQLYQGHDVKWSGEIVRVTEADESGRQRMAALIGSADGSSVESGRVVAITTVWAEQTLNEGDVIEFGGILANLDVPQRLFHLV